MQYQKWQIWRNFVDDFNEFDEICRSVGILSKLMIVMKFR